MIRNGCPPKSAKSFWMYQVSLGGCSIQQSESCTFVQIPVTQTTLSITAVCFSQMFNYVTFRPFPDRCLCPYQKACNILLWFYIIEVVKCEYCISSAYGNVSLVRAQLSCALWLKVSIHDGGVLIFEMLQDIVKIDKCFVLTLKRCLPHDFPCSST